MQNVKAMDGNIPYVRISKAKAKKLYEAGKPIVLCPCKLYPFGGFRPSCTIYSKNADGYDGVEEYALTFEEQARAFKHFNCNYEAGRYAVFYVQEENK